MHVPAGHSGDGCRVELPDSYAGAGVVENRRKIRGMTVRMRDKIRESLVRELQEPEIHWWPLSFRLSTSRAIVAHCILSQSDTIPVDEALPLT